MPNMTYTPKRALLSCQFQKPSDKVTIAELMPGMARMVHEGEIAKEEPFEPTFQGEQESFKHRALKGPRAITFSGYLACYMMFPILDTQSIVNVLVAVEELDENDRLKDFEVVRVPSSRLLVARAITDYIQVSDRNKFVDAIAGGNNDGSRSDLLQPDNGRAN